MLSDSLTDPPGDTVFGRSAALTVASFAPWTYTKSTLFELQVACPVLRTVQVAMKVSFFDIFEPSGGDGSVRLHEKSLDEATTVGVLVCVDKIKRKVGVGLGVTDGVFVGMGVNVDVNVGGTAAAV